MNGCEVTEIIQFLDAVLGAHNRLVGVSSPPGATTHFDIRRDFPVLDDWRPIGRVVRMDLFLQWSFALPMALAVRSAKMETPPVPRTSRVSPAFSAPLNDKGAPGGHAGGGECCSFCERISFRRAGEGSPGRDDDRHRLGRSAPSP